MKQEFAAYAAAGWALCKIKNGEKGAFEEGWSTPAGAYVGQRLDLLRTWAGGVGLLHAFSGTCAIDIDDIKLARTSFAQHGIDLLALLSAPDAVVYGSGRPGRCKLLYALPDPLVSVARKQHGFELRCVSQQGTSMQDVLPVADHLHPDTGKPYRWLKGDFTRLPPLPPELRRAWPHAKAWWPEQILVERKAQAAASSSLTAAAMVGAPLVAAEGMRNEFLSNALFGHLRRGANYEESLDWLRGVNAEKCDPPEEDANVVKIWRNKAHIEPEPIVIQSPAGALPGTEPLVFEVKPELPHGYVWDGTWVHQEVGEKTLLVYAGPLWVQRILRTRYDNGTEVRTLEVMADGGVKTIPAGELLKATEVTLVNLGIYALNEQAKRVRTYLVQCMKDCEKKGLIVDTYSTFGWQPDHTFLLGDRLYAAGKECQKVALAPGIVKLAEGMHPAPHGSLAAWRDAALNLMTPDNMSQAFGLLVGIAAPLMKLSGEKGGIYSMVGESGQGKSTAQNAIGTVWGDPEAFRTVPRDTQTARMIKLSLLANLPMLAEEMTKMEAEDLSTLAYAVSEGRDKDRADQNGDLRSRADSWSTLLVSSSNSSLMDALLLKDGAPAAYRLLEDTVQLAKGARQSDGDRIMRGLVANQGHAGHVLAQYIVDHRIYLSGMIHRAAEQLAGKVRGSTKERIRINMLACTIVAGAVLNATGVLRFNLNDYTEYGLALLRRNMGSQAESTTSSDDVLQSFIDRNHASVLRMNGDSPLNVISIQGRNAPLIMRYDIASEELMINRKALHEYVQERKHSWAEFKAWLDAEGYLKREMRSILSKGSGLPSSTQVRVLVLDNAKMKAIDATPDSRTVLTTAATV